MRQSPIYCNYVQQKAVGLDRGEEQGFLPSLRRASSFCIVLRITPLHQIAIHVFLLLFCLNSDFYSIDRLLSKLLEFVPLHFLLNF